VANKTTECHQSPLNLTAQHFVYVMSVVMRKKKEVFQKFFLFCALRMSENFVSFATCTLPLDGGECLYIQHALNSKLGSHNLDFGKKFKMDLKSDPAHKYAENINSVISILPSVDEKFQLGWAPLGQSRVLKFSFSSRQAMFLVQRWMSKIKIMKGDTDIRITFNGCSYLKARAAPPTKSSIRSESLSGQQHLITMKGPCLIADGHAEHPVGICTDVIMHSTNPSKRKSVSAGARRILPITLANREGGFLRKGGAPLDDKEWVAELAQVRRRLDSVVALTRLRW
jgi:hypothetical protein